MACEIKEMTAADWESVRQIYQDGIETGEATFETVAPEWRVWDGKHLTFGRLVARTPENEIVGFTALSPVSSRPVYSGVAEVSVYVGRNSRKHGIGTQLLQALIAEAELHGIWTLQSSVFPENVATLSLHKRCGFRVVGHREKIARAANGSWRDTLLLERRSQIAGQN
jgi:phosphinothricin acetyltransferase